MEISFGQEAAYCASSKAMLLTYWNIGKRIIEQDLGDSERAEYSKIGVEYDILGGFSFMIKILFVCHGNICRSTMSQYVFQDLINKRGLGELFFIDSKATSREEIGNPPHSGTVRKMQEVGIPVIPHRATQITWNDYSSFDYIIGMDNANMRNLNRMLKGDPEGKLYQFLSFAGSDQEIADPWYTGDFDATYADVLEGSEALLAHILEHDAEKL